jgi:hypothetical protein
VQAFATPHWYRVTPFALRSAAQFRPDGPVAHVDERGRPNRAYLRQAREALRDSFKDGDLDGRRLGTRVGANAWTRALGYFAGTAIP